MKKLYFLLPITLIVLMLASCSTSNKVASVFGKRRYMKGYYFDIAVARAHKSKTENRALLKDKSISIAANQNITPHSITEQIVQPNTAQQKQPIQNGIPITAHVNVAASNVIIYQEAPKTETAAPLATTARGGSTNKAAIFGFICSAIGFGMAVAGIGIVLVPVLCVIGLLLSIHGMQKRDYKIFAILGIVLSCVGLAYWLIGVIGGHITFSWI